MKSISVAVAVTVAILSIAPTRAVAQETRGTIQGRVLDASGAVVPGASVAAVNLATGVQNKTTSNQEGAYSLLFLLPGEYSLTVDAAGFKKVERKGIRVQVNDRVQVDVALEIGNVTDSVQVTAESPLLQTATANLGQVVDTRRISDLPVPHGSPLSMVYLSPGVTNNYPGGMNLQQPQFQQNAITRTNFNGAPHGSSDYTMDGVPNTQNSMADKGSGVLNSPPADMVQEFKMETAFDASVGHTSGTIVNFSLKTGANVPHGTAFYFHRSPGWVANTFFANRNGQPRGEFDYKRWGGTFSGPVYLPKLYNGHNRTFFSYGYEQLRQMEQSAGTTTTVPTAAQVKGDFSSLLGVSSQYQIYDPSTIAPAANGRFSRQPFPGNLIPASRISPIGAKIASYWAQPNVPGRPDGANNYSIQALSTPRLWHNHILRLDHNISDRQRVYVRVAENFRGDGPYRVYWESPAIGNTWKGPGRQIAVDDVYNLNPSTVLNVRYGFNRSEGAHVPLSQGFDVASLGLPANTSATLKSLFSMFPYVGVSGLWALSQETADVLNSSNHSVFASASHQRGSHMLKIGGEARAYKNNLFFPSRAGGAFTFDSAWTQGPLDNSPGAPSGIGQGLAALLLGRPSSGFVDWNDNQAITSTTWALFVHDNWRVSTKLSIDAGLRWEYEGPETERYNRSVRGFDFNAAQPLEAQARAAYAQRPDAALPLDQFRVRGGLLFAGVNGQEREFWRKSLTMFAPRFGFAYEAMPTVVVRGGFGMYPLQLGVTARNWANQIGFNQQTTLVPSLDNGLHFVADLANPYPTGLLRPAGAAQGTATFLGRNVSFYNPDAPSPYSMQWSFNIQKLLPGNSLLEIGYFGNKSIKLLTTHELNALPNQYLSTSPVRDQAKIDWGTANVVNPFAGLLPGTGLNGANIQRQQLLRPYPAYTSVQMQDSQGYAWNNALHVRFERRMKNGFTTQVAYAFSKLMEGMEYLNAGDARPSQVISANDTPHHLAFSGIFELPVGKGKPILGKIGRVGNALVGGWQVGAIWQVFSGQPIGFGNALYYGDIKDIALPRGERTVDRWFNTDGFERNAAKQLSYNLRTLPLRFSGIRSDYYNIWDLSLLKRTAIHERYSLEYRAEFLNSWNHPGAFAVPDTSATSSAFGRTTSNYSVPRTIQMALKFLF